jgi:hypothetical protein
MSRNSRGGNSHFAACGDDQNEKPVYRAGHRLEAFLSPCFPKGNMPSFFG